MAKAKPLSESVKKTLREKAKGTMFTPADLQAIYRKGQGAYLSSGSRNVPMGAWAMGRVNAAIAGKATVKKADAEIFKRARARKKGK